jgi:endonuclease YncB( thermonuclease family)
MDVTTKVRLRGIDASEMRARCEAERRKAIAARDALAGMLKEGGVAIAGIAQDKYGGRVDARFRPRLQRMSRMRCSSADTGPPLFWRAAAELVRLRP